jgi:hypothetical protein
VLEPRALLALTIGQDPATGFVPPDNLIKNGSFEAPVLQKKTWDTFVGNQITDWTIISTDQIKAEVQRRGLSTWVPSQGNQWIELDGDETGPNKSWDAKAMGRAEQGLYTIQQDVTGLTPGQRYVLSFDIAARPGTSRNENRLRASVLADDVAIPGVGGEITAATGQVVAKDKAPRWRNATDVFVAPASGQVTVQFTGLGDDNTFGMFLDNVVLVPDRVIVTMEVPDGEADEVMEAKGVHRTGTLRLVRTGSLNDPLLVKVDIGGDATYSALATDDYTLSNVSWGLTGYFVTIPAGLSSIELVVTPIQDGTDENSETVTVTVLAYTGYELGAPTTRSGTVEILDAPNIATGSIEYRVDLDSRTPLYARAYGVFGDWSSMTGGTPDRLWTAEPYDFRLVKPVAERTDGLTYELHYLKNDPMSPSGKSKESVVVGPGTSFSHQFTLDDETFGLAAEAKYRWYLRFFVDANRDGEYSPGEPNVLADFEKVEQNRKALWILQLKDEKKTHAGTTYDSAWDITGFFDELIAAAGDVTYARNFDQSAQASYSYFDNRIFVTDATNVEGGIGTIIHESTHALDDARNWAPGTWPTAFQIDGVEAAAWIVQGLLDKDGPLKSIRQFEALLNTQNSDVDDLKVTWRNCVVDLQYFPDTVNVGRPQPWGPRAATYDDVQTARDVTGLFFNMTALMETYQHTLAGSGVEFTLAAQVENGPDSWDIPEVFLAK